MPQAPIVLPTSKIMAGLVELCGGDPVAWEYATKQLADKLNQAGIADKPDAQKVYGKFVACHAAADARSKYNTVENAMNSADFDFRDQSRVTEVQGKNAASELHGKLNENQKVNIVIAVSHMAQLLRGYQIDGKQIPEEEGKSFDQLLNEFLVLNGYVSSGGDENGSNIFECEDGRVKKVNGQGVKADPVIVRQLIEEKFPKFMKDKELNATVQGVEHPSSPQVSDKQEVKSEGPSADAGKQQPDQVATKTSPGTTAGGG